MKRRRSHPRLRYRVQSKFREIISRRASTPAEHRKNLKDLARVERLQSNLNP